MNMVNVNVLPDDAADAAAVLAAAGADTGVLRTHAGTPIVVFPLGLGTAGAVGVIGAFMRCFGWPAGANAGPASNHFSLVFVNEDEAEAPLPLTRISRAEALRFLQFPGRDDHPSWLVLGAPGGWFSAYVAAVKKERVAVDAQQERARQLQRQEVRDHMMAIIRAEQEYANRNFGLSPAV